MCILGKTDPIGYRRAPSYWCCLASSKNGLSSFITALMRMRLSATACDRLGSAGT